MTHRDAGEPEQVAWQGRWIAAMTKGGWEYASRARNISAAVIVALDEDHVILVEQYRVPLHRNTIELPAGLIGDEEGRESEDPLESARRELEEETGYRAAHWRDLGEYFSSPGMTTESFTLLLATGLTRVGEGGGVEGEDITVHRVPLAGLGDFVSDARRRGLAIDTRIVLLTAKDLLQGAV